MIWVIVSRTGTLWFYVLYSDVISVLYKQFLSNKMLHLLLWRQSRCLLQYSNVEVSTGLWKLISTTKRKTDCDGRSAWNRKKQWEVQILQSPKYLHFFERSFHFFFCQNYDTTFFFLLHQKEEIWLLLESNLLCEINTLTGDKSWWTLNQTVTAEWEI